MTSALAALSVLCALAARAEGAAAPARGAPAGAPQELPAAVPEQPSLAPLVSLIELHLPPGTDPTGLASLVAIHKGLPLSKREVRRSVERLYATGRFEDLVVWKRPVSDGTIAIVIEAKNRTWIDRVEFEGNRILGTIALRKASDVDDGRLEYFPEFVERIVARLVGTYGRVGYNRARIVHELRQDVDGKTSLVFRIQEGEPTRIRTVSVAGDPQLPVEEILSTLGMGPGVVLDLNVLDRGFEALRARYLAERHFGARFGQPEITLDTEGGAEVRLPITAGPAIEFRFTGNRALGAEQLQGALAYAGEEPLDEMFIAHLAERIGSYYRLMGFADARVGARQVRSGDRSRSSVVFEIDEGEPLRVTELLFEGNARFTAEELRERVHEALREAVPEIPLDQDAAGAQMLTGTAESRRTLRYVVNPTEVYFEPAYQKAISRILDLYRADGYLQALAEMPIVQRDERLRAASVTLRVKEGPQTLVSELLFPGAPAGLTEAGLAALCSIRKGSPLSALEVERSRQAIQSALGKRGHLFARVEDEERFSPDRTSASVTFRMSPGPQVRVGRILVQGLVRTDEAVVRGALALEEDQILDPDAVARSQRNLLRLGIFRSVSIRIDAPEVTEAVKDLYVTAEERKTWYYGWGGGVSLVEGVRSFLEVGKVNLFGQALQVQLQGKVNYFGLSPLPDVRNAQSGLDAIGRRANLAILYPRLLWLLPTEVGLRLNLIHEYVIRPSYKFQRNAAVLGADLVTDGPLSASLQYEVENVLVARTETAADAALSKTDIERLRFEEGRVYLHSLRPSVRLDFRDDPINPRRGFLMNGSVELVQSLGSPRREVKPFSFLKTSGQASAYIPVARESVLALSLSGGKIFLVDETSRTIAPKRFFMGGSGTMRGFFDDSLVPEDRRQSVREEVRECQATINKTGCSAAALAVAANGQVTSDGGELFTLARAELRMPLVSQVETALFLDAGNLWLDQQQFEPLKLRYAAGVGLRVVTPIGPAALDLGVNLTPDALLNENRFVPHFSIGLF